MRDLEIKILFATDPIGFQNEVNQILYSDEWRILETEMSVTDSHFWAIIVRSKTKRKDKALADLPSMEQANEVIKLLNDIKNILGQIQYYVAHL